MRTRAVLTIVAFILCLVGTGLWWHYHPRMADEGPGGNSIRLSLRFICESVIYCDKAVKRIEKVDDESIRSAVLLAAEAEPRMFKPTAAGYVLVYQHGDTSLRSVVSKAEALATSSSLRGYPDSKSRIEAIGVLDSMGNGIRIQGDRDKVTLTSSGGNGCFGDGDDEETYINLNEGYFYDRRYPRLGDYDQIIDTIRRTYPTEPPLSLIPESRY